MRRTKRLNETAEVVVKIALAFMAGAFTFKEYNG